MMMPSSLSEWLDYQSSLHPQNMELGLDRVRQVWRALGQPRPARKVITVAGTNGKGSCVALLGSLLRAAGYAVGAYTSPHLLRYNERVCLQGQPVADSVLCDAFVQVEQARGDTLLTYFEFGALAALWIFSQRNLDIALLEVGLGGRLDAVNIVDADVALVTTIALDHMDWLGDDLESIAAEKAGIFRAHRPAIYASVDMPTNILKTAQRIGADLLRLGVNYHYRVEASAWHWTSDNQQRYALPLPNLRGPAQLRNAAAALQVLECLETDYPVTQAAVRQGLLAVQLPGRMAIYQPNARWILDVAHNPQAIQILADQIKRIFVAGKVIAVVGLLQDKLQTGLFEPLLEPVDAWFILDLSTESRGASAQHVKTLLPAQTTTLCHAPEEGFVLAHEAAGSDDLVLVFGSFAVVAAAMRWLKH
jgi:dihydrofolate synthase/folylpolyglutamate synthase